MHPNSCGYALERDHTAAFDKPVLLLTRASHPPDYLVVEGIHFIADCNGLHFDATHFEVCLFDGQFL